MAIRPIELQMLVHRTADVNRLEQGEGRRPDVAHQQFADIIQKKTEEEARQVLQLTKTEQEAVDKDGSNKNKHEGKRKDKQKNKQEQKQGSGSTSMFDITV